MVEQSDPNRKCDDIEAVRLIAKNLLENKKGSLDHFTRFLLKSFANPHIEEVGDMLQVSYRSLCDITRTHVMIANKCSIHFCRQALVTGACDSCEICMWFQSTREQKVASWLS